MSWQLADAEDRAQNPTFQIPPEVLRKSLRKEDHVKLIFELDEPFEQPSGERMWVKVTNVLGEGHYIGVLQNYPVVVAPAISYGDAVEFEARHVIDTCLASFEGR